MAPRSSQLHEASAYFVEQGRRERTMVTGSGIKRSHIRPGPDEAVALGKHYPRAIIIETQPLPGRRGDFDGMVGM